MIKLICNVHAVNKGLERDWSVYHQEFYSNNTKNQITSFLSDVLTARYVESFFTTCVCFVSLSFCQWLSISFVYLVPF